MSDDEIAAVQAALARIEAQQDRIEKRLTDLQATLVNRTDRIEDFLIGIRDDVGATMQHSGLVHQAHDRTRAELQGMAEVMAALQRTVRELEAKVRELQGGA